MEPLEGALSDDQYNEPLRTTRADDERFFCVNVTLIRGQSRSEGWAVMSLLLTVCLANDAFGVCVGHFKRSVQEKGGGP